LIRLSHGPTSGGGDSIGLGPIVAQRRLGCLTTRERPPEVGVDGVVVSNHGGRQLDSARSRISALPEIVAAVEDRLPVLVDGGIRSGLDVVKALAPRCKSLFARPSVGIPARCRRTALRHAYARDLGAGDQYCVKADRLFRRQGRRSAHAGTEGQHRVARTRWEFLIVNAIATRGVNYGTRMSPFTQGSAETNGTGVFCKIANAIDVVRQVFLIW